MSDVTPSSELAREYYVVGFAHDGQRVALIRKNRPAWQAGRLNGIGGHVEPGEEPRKAMEREFREETGWPVDHWRWLTHMTFPGAAIDFYTARLTSWELDALRSMTDEEVVLRVWPVTPWEAIIPNLSWLVPLAMYEADLYAPFVLRATVAEAVQPLSEPANRPGSRGGEA